MRLEAAELGSGGSEVAEHIVRVLGEPSAERIEGSAPVVGLAEVVAEIVG